MNHDRSLSHASGLTEQPFAPTADPNYFYAVRDAKSCLVRLWHSIDRREGIAIVSGAPGAGKTMILRKVLADMTRQPERYNTAVIGSAAPSWTSFGLLEAVVHQFRIRPPHRTFSTYLEALSRYLSRNRDRINTLIIDEAQNLNKRGQIEFLRLTQNLETHREKLLNIVLLAQPDWQTILDAVPGFKQRINLAYALTPLKPEEVGELIRYRLARACANAPATPEFSDDATRLVSQYSQGNPREVITLCRNTLSFATEVGQTWISDEMVQHTIAKTMPGGAERLEEVDEAQPDIAEKHENIVPLRPAIRGLDRGVPPEPEGVAMGGTDRRARANALLLKAAQTRRTAR